MDEAKDIKSRLLKAESRARAANATWSSIVLSVGARNVMQYGVDDYSVAEALEEAPRWEGE